MKKAFLIGLKDVKIAFRDRASLVLMLLAPFVLTLGLGLVTGRFSGDDGNSGLQDIPVVIVNHDEGQLGQALEEVFASPELETLLAAESSDDEAAARARVDEDEIAAVVNIPAGFTDSIIPAGTEATLSEPVAVEIYANPARPISSGVVQSVVEGFVSQIETALVSGQVAVTQLLARNLLDPAELPTVAQEIGSGAATDETAGLITIERLAVGAEADSAEEEFDVLAILAPGMAIFFLMYTVSYGGRSLLQERNEGTLSRLLSTPTGMPEVLGGKVIGIFLTGLAQLLILIGGTSVLFQLDWGSPPAVLILIIATVAAATAWGILLAAFARTPGQVGSVGTAIMLLFGILGGTFIPAAAFPQTLRAARLVTPNAWALDGLAELALGGGLVDIVPYTAALLVMALVLFTIAVIAFQRRGVLVR